VTVSDADGGAAPATAGADQAPAGYAAPGSATADRRTMAEDVSAGRSTGALASQIAILDVVHGRMPTDAGTMGGLAAHVAATAFTGAATVSIPIQASPARGFEPALSLDYSSRAGDGVFGQGFGLDLPAIERRTNLRIPRYDGSDTFQLGSMALARLADRGTVRLIGGVPYQVTPYERRSTETVERIEHWSGGDTGDAGFWRTIDADGVVTVYGVTVHARIADPDDSRRVFAWLPQARYDASGCAIAFGYQQEDGTGVPDAVYEHNRQRSANRYLRSVAYGNEVPFQPGAPLELPPGPWHVEVVCDYGEYDFSPGNDAPHRPVRPWAARELPFSDYSAGFERRTHRLCRAIALFHRFAELGPEPVLVRTMSFGYDLAGSGGLATHLTQAQSRGYRYASTRSAGDRYWTADDAPATFGYLAPDFRTAEFAPLLTRTPGVPPVVDNADAYCLADLDGAGVAGIVYADSRSLMYWRPVVDPADQDGPVRFEPETPAPVPVERRVSGAFSLADVTGDGRLSLIVDTAGRAGFYGRAPGGAWRPFTAFEQHVTDSAAGGATRAPDGAARTAGGASPAGGYSRADLTGNGFPDLVRLTEAGVTYAPNLGRAGYGAFERASPRAGLPAAVTSSPRSSTRFADVLGGGEQLVLVQSGRLTCWPSLGYGVFGAPVEPARVPRFDDVTDDHVLLADLTGTGPADLILMRPGRADIYLNQGGNTFAPRPLTVPTPGPAPAAVAVADVTADGRQSLVFSTGGQQPRHYALTLCPGRQPFRLTEVDAGLGLRTRLSYSTSARLRLQDAARGEPWQLDLPFPVIVVESIEEDDEIAAVRTTTSYRYRDGYFDPEERVFAGFARVDEREAEALLPAGPPGSADPGSADPGSADPGSADPGSADPGGSGPPAGVFPTLTRTWFQLGAFAIEGLDRALEREYFSGDPDAYPMPGPTFEWGGVAPDGALLRQAHLALAGAPRRTEVYDADRPGVPYRVDQTEMTARLLAPPVDGFGAFLVHDRESIVYGYEREPGDPAVHHSFTLDVDEFGEVRRECAVFYRRRPAVPALPGQDRTVVMAGLTDYLPARDEPDLLLYGYARQSRSYAVTGIDPPTVRGLYYHARQIAEQVARALRHDAPATAELMAADRVFYQGSDGGQAPPRPIAAPPRIVRRDVAAFTGVQIADLLAGVPLPAPIERFLDEEGGYDYESATDLWWRTGDSTVYDAGLFWQPRLLADPVASLHPGRGATQALRYDPASMAVVETVVSAAAGGLLDQRTTVEVLDYQTLLPQRTRSVNGVVTEVLYDPLGRLFAAAFRGQVWVDGAVREIGFPPLPIDDPASWPQPRDLAELASDPAAFLLGAAAFAVHDPLGWRRDGTPSFSAAVAAAGYPQDPAGPAEGPPLLAVSYGDGSGQLVQTSTRAEAVTLPGDGSGTAGPFRWAVADRVRYNGLRLPLQSYLPFFTDSPAFVPTAELLRTAVGPVSTYDPAGRPARTDFPQGTFPRAFYSTTAYGPWSVTQADTDDTVLSSPYYQYYIGGGHALPPRERAALLAAAGFDGTPATWHLGVLGSAIACDRLLTRDQVLTSVYRYDDAGRRVSAADPRQAAAGRANLALHYGLTPEPIKSVSVDAGTSIILDDSAGAPLLSVDGRGNLLLFERDALHRPTAVTVTEQAERSAAAAGQAGWQPAPGTPITAQRNLYGDTLDASGATIYPSPAQRGLLGRLCVCYDQAGRHEVDAYALTGEPLSSSESFSKDVTREPDWRAGARTTWAELFAALAGQLEDASFGAATWYDPLGKPLRSADPGGNTTAWRYNPAGAVSAADLALQGSPAAPYAAGIAYSAAGQRRYVGYADARGGHIIGREFRYDPANQRLTAVRSVRLADGEALQDLAYVYDPAGNLTFAADPAAPGGSAGVSADLGYGYDALYRLTAATGRAVATFGPRDAASGHYDQVYAAPPDPQLSGYSASFGYDHADNCVHQAFTLGQRAWATTLTPAEDSNRATAGEVFDPADFDDSGNTLRLPTVSELAWDYNDALRSVRYAAGPDSGAGSGAGSEHYAYEAGGARRRRVAVGPDGQVTDIRYFPALDIIRQLGPDGSVLAEYQRIRLADADQCLGEVLRWTIGEPPAGVPDPQRRYLLDNLVGSAMLELAADASMISYEEYSPFGATVFATGPALDSVALKAYRYTGQERDQTSGLAYHGARYYAPWLSRWISPDPAGTVDGLNLYAYAADNPTTHLDPTGLAKATKIPKYLNDVKAKFGVAAARKVLKSRLLRERVKLLRGRGWRIVRAAVGASADRVARQIEIEKPAPFNLLDFIQSLSHESGHGGYTPPPETAWPSGTRRKDYLKSNVKIELDDEAEATLFNAAVRREYKDLGEGDIGIAGQHERRYKTIYRRLNNNEITRAEAVSKIARRYKQEVGSQSGLRYDLKWKAYYKTKWRNHFGAHVRDAP
jgi:insecticidal toxin complex protein TccC